MVSNSSEFNDANIYTSMIDNNIVYNLVNYGDYNSGYDDDKQSRELRA